jgi:hypothetical protein
MCCNSWAFLTALQNHWDASDPRYRREIQTRRGSQGLVTTFLPKQWRDLLGSVTRRGSRKAGDQAVVPRS